MQCYIERDVAMVYNILYTMVYTMGYMTVYSMQFCIALNYNIATVARSN